jgi:hypothetical protein
MGMRLGTWNVRNPYRSEPLKTVARELAVYRLALVGLQIRWDKGGTQSAEDYIFYGKGDILYIRESHEQ